MPDSIFDFASQKGAGKPKPKTKAIPTPPPLPTAPTESIKTLGDMKVTYSKFLKQKDELDNQLGEVFNRTGINLKTVQRMLDNPSNYEGVNAKAFLEQREKYRNDIWRKTGEEDKGKILSAKALEEENRQKNKGIGARKKNWTFIR